MEEEEAGEEEGFHSSRSEVVRDAAGVRSVHRRPLFAEQGGDGDVDAAVVSDEESDGEAARDASVSGVSEVEGFESANADAFAQQQLGARAEAFARKYPAYGRGLVDRLMALEDAGIRCV